MPSTSAALSRPKKPKIKNERKQTVDEPTTQALANQPDLPAPTTNESGVTPANAKDAVAAAASALVDADQPVTPAPQPEPTPQPQTEEPEGGQPEAEPEPEAATAPSTTEEPATDDEEDYSAPAPAPNPVPQLDSSKFIDENGYVDIKALTEAFNNSLAQAQQTAAQTAQAEVNAQRLEEKQWQSAIKKYPQLENDRSLRDIVQNARIGKATEAYQKAGSNQEALAAIKIPTPTQIATELFKRLGEAKTQGVKEATENVRVQQNTTYQETASTPGDVGTTGKKAELFGQIRNPDRITADKASKDLLKELIFGEENNQ